MKELELLINKFNNITLKFKQNLTKEEKINILYKYIYLLNDKKNSDLLLEYLKRMERIDFKYSYYREKIFLILNNYEDIKKYNKLRKLENLNVFDDFFIKALKIFL